MRRLALATLVLFSGCTISVVDSRISREELTKAFEQRDQIMKKMAEALKAVNAKIPEPKK